MISVKSLQLNQRIFPEPPKMINFGGRLFEIDTSVSEDLLNRLFPTSIEHVKDGYTEFVMDEKLANIATISKILTVGLVYIIRGKLYMYGQVYDYLFEGFPYFNFRLSDPSKVTLVTHDNLYFDNSKTNIIGMEMFNEHGEYPDITDKLCKILEVARCDANMIVDLKHQTIKIYNATPDFQELLHIFKMSLIKNRYVINNLQYLYDPNNKRSIPTILSNSSFKIEIGDECSIDFVYPKCMKYPKLTDIDYVKPVPVNFEESK